jgi:hypothetical protein
MLRKGKALSSVEAAAEGKWHGCGGVYRATLYSLCNPAATLLDPFTARTIFPLTKSYPCGFEIKRRGQRYQLAEDFICTVAYRDANYEKITRRQVVGQIANCRSRRYP